MYVALGNLACETATGRAAPSKNISLTSQKMPEQSKTGAWLILGT